MQLAYSYNQLFIQSQFYECAVTNRQTETVTSDKPNFQYLGNIYQNSYGNYSTTNASMQLSDYLLQFVNGFDTARYQIYTKTTPNDYIETMSNFILRNTLNNWLIALMCICVLCFIITFVMLQRSVFKKQQKTMSLIQQSFIDNYGAYIPHDMRTSQLFNDFDTATTMSNYASSLKENRKTIVPLKAQTFKMANQCAAVGLSVVQTQCNGQEHMPSKCNVCLMLQAIVACGIFVSYMLNLFLQMRRTTLQTYNSPMQISDEIIRSYELTLKAAKFFQKEDFDAAINHITNLPVIYNK